MKVLVTGGAGYVGSHACKALARAGHEPVTYDNLSSGYSWAVRWGPFEHGDVLDTAALTDAIARHKPEAVMHFAATANVGESIARPDICYRKNVGGIVSLIQAMRAQGVAKLVFSSTCAIYGNPDRIPIVEGEACAPINPYGRSKWMCEQILRDCAGEGLGVVALRYFNAAGADPDGEIGEAHEPETHLIPLVLQAAAGARDKISIYGEDYGTPDGTCVRDYIHVVDLAAAHLKAMEACAPGAFKAYNLGTGAGISVREVVEAARRITGREIPAVIAPRRDGDPEVLVADSSLAAKELGWTPSQSDPDTIIQTAWRWMAGANPAR